jgi:hypothetical protein
MGRPIVSVPFCEGQATKGKDGDIGRVAEMNSALQMHVRKER